MLSVLLCWLVKFYAALCSFGAYPSLLMKTVFLVQICMDHILAVLKTPAERASGFVALGEMAGALDGELLNYLPTITSHLRDAVCYMCQLLRSPCHIFSS